MKKLIFSVCAVLAMSAAVRAEEAEAPVTPAAVIDAGKSTVDLSSVFSSLRVGDAYVFIPKGMNLTTAYAPVITLHDTAGNELVNLNAGGALNTNDAKGSPMLGLGFRLDKLISKPFQGEWAKAHISTSALPTIEISACTIWYSPEHIWVGGVNMALKF